MAGPALRLRRAVAASARSTTLSASRQRRAEAVVGPQPVDRPAQLGQAERDVAAAIAARDKLEQQMASTNAHWELSALGEQLAAAQAEVAAAEERGWPSPPKPKPSASP